MRVPETRAKLIGPEPILKRLARSDGTLRGRRHTVHPRRPDLADSVPVESGAFFGSRDVVDERNLDPVAPVGVDRRPRELAVDDQHLPLDTIWRQLGSRNVEGVTPRNSGLGDIMRVRAICGQLAPWTGPIFSAGTVSGLQGC